MTPTERRQGLRLLGAALLSLLGAGHDSARAQGPSIWRCGPDGRQFSDRPCGDGQVLAGPAPVSADAQREAQQVAQREQALADALARERLQRNQALPGEGLRGIRSSTGPGATEPVRFAKKRMPDPHGSKSHPGRLSAPRTDGPSRPKLKERNKDAPAPQRRTPPGAAPAEGPTPGAAAKPATGWQRQG